jgi:FAD dependent oxidoreductase TIGR03364
MNNAYDLIIIGGGILGTSHAYHALQQGLRVAILEKNQWPRGSSIQNFGQVVPSGFDTRWQIYGRRSLEIYKNLQAQFDISARQNGTIYIASDDEEMTLLEELATINRANDYASEVLSASECLRRYPGLRSDYCRGGLFFPEEMTVEPRTAVHRILQYLSEQKGLQYFPHTLAVEIEKSGSGYRARAADGRVFYAPKVLVCSGYEFKTLFPELFLKSDLQLVKLQMLLLESQPAQRIPGSILSGWSIRRYESFHECPSYPAIKAKENPDSLDKRWGVHILFKQASDGSVIVGDSHEYANVADAEQLGMQLREDINRFMLSEARKIFDLETWELRESWFGLYAQCKNQEIFRHTIDGNIHILTGIGGKGMTGSLGFAQSNIDNYL